jgi:phosphopantetheine--protein transferase-like protein
MWFKKTVGVDIVDVKRFEEYTDNKEHHFLKKVFTPYEIDYCFIHKEPAKHLAGLFTAKEAVSKALGVERFPYTSIHIRHTKHGKPEAYVGLRKLKVSVSIAHTDTYATAVALA